MKKPSLQKHQTLHSRLAAARGRSSSPVSTEGWSIVGAGVAGTLVIAILLAIKVIIPAPHPQTIEPSPMFEPPTPSWRRALDGVVVSSAQGQNPPLVAVAIDNMVDARPVSGLEDALFVFEFPAEATITRFLPVFDARDITKGLEIGPVRSARPYMIELAESVGAVLAHSGGSPAALELLRTPKRSIDEFSNSAYFWRDAKRRSPHNLYTNIGRLSRHPLVEGFTGALLPLVWEERDQTKWDGDEKRLSIGYPDPYTVAWRWDADSRRFYRLDSVGAQESTRAGAAIAADAVVIQFTDIRILDTVGRREIRTIGSGEAMVFQGKGVEVGFWKREKSGGRFALVDANGQPIALRPGRMWWTIVPKGTDVKFE